VDHRASTEQISHAKIIANTTKAAWQICGARKPQP
jgi:hypothetical protein